MVTVIIVSEVKANFSQYIFMSHIKQGKAKQATHNWILNKLNSRNLLIVKKDILMLCQKLLELMLIAKEIFSKYMIYVE